MEAAESEGSVVQNKYIHVYFGGTLCVIYSCLISLYSKFHEGVLESYIFPKGQKSEKGNPGVDISRIRFTGLWGENV